MKPIMKKLLGSCLILGIYISFIIALLGTQGVGANIAIFLLGVVLMLLTSLLLFTTKLQEYARGAALVLFLLVFLPFFVVVTFLGFGPLLLSML